MLLNKQLSEAALAYRLKSLPILLLESGQEERLKTLLADDAFINMAIAKVGINWREDERMQQLNRTQAK
jgi:hypothetical protein